MCLSGRLNKVIENGKLLGGNTEETDTRTPEEIAAETARTAAKKAADDERARVDAIKQGFKDIEETITETYTQLKEALETKNIEPCDKYVPSPDHYTYIDDANIKNNLNIVKDNIDTYNQNLETLEEGITIQQKDYSNIKVNIQIMIDTINKLEIRKQKEDEIKEMLSRDNLNKSELRQILEDVNKNEIKLGANIIKDIRSKLADDKWKPQDWISATCNIKECSDKITDEPPIIENKDSYENYLFYEHPFQLAESKYIYYNIETSSCLAMDIEGNAYALKLDKNPTQLKYEEIEYKYPDCIFNKISMGRGDALSVCSGCNNINNIQTDRYNVKKPITSLLKGITNIDNKPKSEYSDYLVVKNNNLYEKYKKLLNKNPQTGGQTNTQPSPLDTTNTASLIYAQIRETVNTPRLQRTITTPPPSIVNTTVDTTREDTSSTDNQIRPIGNTGWHDGTVINISNYPFCVRECEQNAECDNTRWIVDSNICNLMKNMDGEDSNSDTRWKHRFSTSYKEAELAKAKAAADKAFAARKAARDAIIAENTAWNATYGFTRIKDTNYGYTRKTFKTFAAAEEFANLHFDGIASTTDMTINANDLPQIDIWIKGASAPKNYGFKSKSKQGWYIASWGSLARGMPAYVKVGNREESKPVSGSGLSVLVNARINGGSQTDKNMFGGSDDEDLTNFINAVFTDNLNVRKYLVKFDIHNSTEIDDDNTYLTCKNGIDEDSEPYYSSPDIFNKLINGKIRFVNNDNSEIEDDDIDYIKTIFEENTFLPNMSVIPDKFMDNSRQIKNYLVNLMVLKIDGGKDDSKTFDYDKKYQIYIIADKDNKTAFKNSLKIYRDADNEIHCPAIINQKTGRLLDNYDDNDLLYIINMEPIFKFYSLDEKDKIILEEINQSDENTEEVAIKIKNILSNKVTLFSNKSNNKVLTEEEKDLILTEEQTKRLTRQKNAWKIVGGKNFNGDISKLFNKLEIVKDINYPNTGSLSVNKPLNNLDFNKTLMKVKFKYIKGDRGWKISNNSIFNKNLFNEESFDKLHEGDQTYKYPIKFNINDKVYSHIPGNKLDIKTLFENIFYDKWFFEEVTYLANKPNDYKNNPILLSYLNNNNIDTKVEGEISHSLVENNYIITSKLFERSELIYNDLTSNYIKESDLDMNLYYYTKPKEKSEYIDLSKSDITNKIKDLYYGENSNKNDAKKIYINYINNKYLKDNINNNIVLTNNIYGSNLTDIKHMFKFTKVEDIDEGYKINYLDNNISLTNDNLTYQVIKQSGNYEGYYVIKDIKNDTFMYVDNIEELTDIKLINFDKPRKFTDKYLFKIETEDFKKSVPNAISRKDLTDGNYNIKLHKTSSYLHTLLSKSTTEFYLDKLENIFKLNNKNLNKNLQSTYKLEDNTSIVDIITEYIPFYSNNYSVFVIRDKNKPSNVLYVNEDNTPIWVTYTIENLLNNKTVLEKCLWKFERKNNWWF